MLKKELISKLNRNVDRRTFLRACGALGVGAIAGGVIQSKYDVVGLGRGVQKVAQTRVAMGTYVTVTAVHESRDQAEDAIGRAFDEMDRLIAVFNRYDSASPVSILNRDGRLESPPPELTHLMGHAEYFHAATNGAFDVTVKPVLDLLTANFTDNGARPPTDDEIREALQLVGAEGVAHSPRRIDFKRPGVGITLDGVAKGHIVDSMSDVLAANGVESHLVNAGGDIRTRGASIGGKPWTIAVEDPKKNRDYPDVIRMNDGAVAASGKYEIYYDKAKVFHHIIDPKSGLSPQSAVSVTVRARSVADADAVSTAAFVLGPERAVGLAQGLAAKHGTACLVIGEDGVRRQCPGWNQA